jgi:hypothetical protein
MLHARNSRRSVQFQAAQMLGIPTTEARFVKVSLKVVSPYQSTATWTVRHPPERVAIGWAASKAVGHEFRRRAEARLC